MGIIRMVVMGANGDVMGAERSMLAIIDQSFDDAADMIQCTWSRSR